MSLVIQVILKSGGLSWAWVGKVMKRLEAQTWPELAGGSLAAGHIVRSLALVIAHEQAALEIVAAAAVVAVLVETTTTRAPLAELVALVV